MITIKQIQELEKEEIIKNNNIELTELENEKYLIQIECKKGYVNSNILKAERIIDCFKNIGISNVMVHLFDEQHPKLTILKIKGEK